MTKHSRLLTVLSVAACAAAVVLLCHGCGGGLTTTDQASSGNPLLNPPSTPYDLPPFDQIKPEHFEPAFEQAFASHEAEIEAIASSSEPPTFDNTIAALDRSGELLGDITAIFMGLKGACTSDELQAADEVISPRLAAHRDRIMLDPRLFQRIKAVHDQRNELGLNAEQLFLLEHLYGDAVRAGALLDQDKQSRLKEINQEMAQLRVRFSKNLLAETNGFQLVIDSEDDLDGLPEPVIVAAAKAAEAADQAGKWVFTTQKPSMLPFLTYAKNRDLRQQLYTAYIKRGDNNNEYDNKRVMADLVKLRVEKAQLLGYDTYADYVLERRMAGTPARVYELLDQLWEASLPVAKEEVAAMQAIIDGEGGGFKLASWDWWYYAEKLRKQQYDLDDNELRPYFPLNQVREGAFYVANQLYGLQFEPIDGVPTPHPDAQAFKVTEADGSFCTIIYMDFHPRASKRPGAWCGSYRSQWEKDGKRVDPITNLVCNFTPPSGDTPALLSLDEVTTLFHELGHGLDVMLSDVTYRRRYRSSDFSELPSQIMEHWALEPTVMQVYARHYQTGAVIPDELLAKIGNSKYFNQGFNSVEYLAASLLDMELHTLQEPVDIDVDRFENELFERRGLMPEIVSRYRTTYFAHIVGGYAAGYYSYIWSGVLDSDAFEAFKETSLFDQETAHRFRTEILEKNGTRDYLEMYLAFRGREPEITPLLRDRGLLR